MPRDRFGPLAGAYARFRPAYPAALFDHLAQLAPSRRLALDVACGTGQALAPLAARFERALGVDASAEQLARVLMRHDGAAVVRGRAEALPLRAGSVDLVVVAQALHWFDVERFVRDAERVLRPGGVLAAWCYGLLRVDARIDAVVDRLYGDVLGRDWPARRRHVERGYADLPFASGELVAPAFAMEAAWDLEQLLGYLGTWTAVANHRARTGQDPLPDVRARLSELWGRERRVVWPLALRVARPGARAPAT